MSVVLDASALLAVLLDERGAEQVAAALAESKMSAVNIGEVLTKAAERGADPEATLRIVRSFGVQILAFEERHAVLTARYRTQTKSLGLSFGDRACLALATVERAVVLTADRRWSEADLGIAVKQIR